MGGNWHQRPPLTLWAILNIQASVNMGAVMMVRVGRIVGKWVVGGEITGMG